MDHNHPRGGYSGLSESPEQEYLRQRYIARRSTDANDRAMAEAKYKKDHLDAIRSGIPESSLHPPHAGMDLKAANAALDFARGGSQGNSARDTAAFNSGPVDRAVHQGPTPNGDTVEEANQHATTQAAASKRRDWMGVQGISNPPPINNADGRGVAPSTVTQVHVPSIQSQIGAPATGRETPQQVAQIKANAMRGAAPLATTEVQRPGTLNRVAALDVNSPGIQGALDSVPSTAAAIAQQKASGQTPFGTASVRFAKPGEQLQNPIGTGVLASGETLENGVQRNAPPKPVDWQQKIMADHPAIGIAGSQANLEFVRAHKAATAAGGQVDPHAIASQVMANIAKKPESPLAPKAGIAGITPDIAAPAPVGGPLAKATFAGGEVPAADWTNPAPPTVATEAGQTARSFFARPGGTGAGTPNGSPAGRGAMYAGVKDFVKGFASGKPSAPIAPTEPVSSAMAGNNFPLTAPKSSPLSMALPPGQAPITDLAEEERKRLAAEAARKNGTGAQ